MGGVTLGLSEYANCYVRFKKRTGTVPITRVQQLRSVIKGSVRVSLEPKTWSEHGHVVTALHGLQGEQVTRTSDEPLMQAPITNPTRALPLYLATCNSHL